MGRERALRASQPAARVWLKKERAQDRRDGRGLEGERPDSAGRSSGAGWLAGWLAGCGMVSSLARYAARSLASVHFLTCLQAGS